MNANEMETKPFSIEDVISYANVKITNANDNKQPVKVVAVKIVVWAVIAALAVGLFLI